MRLKKPALRAAAACQRGAMVTRGAVPDEIRKSILLWAGCIAGALEDKEYEAKLAAAGFEEIDIEPTRMYTGEDVTSFLKDKGFEVEALVPQVEGKFMSAFIRARKPI